MQWHSRPGGARLCAMAQPASQPASQRRNENDASLRLQRCRCGPLAAALQYWYSRGPRSVAPTLHCNFALIARKRRKAFRWARAGPRGASEHGRDDLRARRKQVALPEHYHHKPLAQAPATMLTAATLTLLLVLIITLHSTLTLSDHFTCSWKPHNGNPGDYLYQLFCEARLLRDHKDPDTKADWVCAGGDVGKVGTHIADWGHLKKNVLELGELVASVLTC